MKKVILSVVALSCLRTCEAQVGTTPLVAPPMTQPLAGGTASLDRVGIDANSTLGQIEGKGIQVIIPLADPKTDAAALRGLSLKEICARTGCTARLFRKQLILIKLDKTFGLPVLLGEPEDDDQPLDPFLGWLVKAPQDAVKDLGQDQLIFWKQIDAAGKDAIRATFIKASSQIGRGYLKATQISLPRLDAQDDTLFSLQLTPMAYYYRNDQYQGLLNYSDSGTISVLKAPPRVNLSSPGWDPKPVGLLADDPEPFAQALAPQVHFEGQVLTLADIFKKLVPGDKPAQIKKEVVGSYYLSAGDYSGHDLVDDLKIASGLEIRDLGKIFLVAPSGGAQFVEQVSAQPRLVEATRTSRMAKLKPILDGEFFQKKIAPFRDSFFIAPSVVSYTDMNADEQKKVVEIMGAAAIKPEELKFRFLISYRMVLSSKAAIDHVETPQSFLVGNDPRVDLVRPKNQAGAIPEYNPAIISGQVLADDGASLTAPAPKTVEAKP